MSFKFASQLNKTPILLFVLILIISIYLKIVPVLNYNFPFTMDQARDMLDIRHIVELRNPTLIGPTTSINGVFLGPFYYYFNLIPYLISGGDPAALTYWNIAWYVGAGVLLFWFFYRSSVESEKDLAFILASIFVMTPAFFYSSRFFWSANPMPYMSAFYFLAMFVFFKKSSNLNAAIAGLISGLSMQVEAAFGVIFFPFFFLFALIRRTNFKHLAIAIGAFGATLLPQALFEVRNGFVMSKTFFSELFGDSQILGDKIPINEVFNSHLNSYLDFMDEILQLPWDLGAVLVFIAAGYLAVRVFQKKLDANFKLIFLLATGFVLFSFIFYMFYHHPLKGWYLLGLRVPYIFLISLFLADLYRIKKFSLGFKALVFFGLAFSFFNTYVDQSRFVPKSIEERSGDKSNLRNEIEAIDWVYTKASGKGFKAYNYIPSVYDFPYQYLYWWHGTKKYGYQPAVLTYKDGVPEYIKDNDKFFTKRKPLDEELIFLIYEKDENGERQAAWLGDFTKYCTIEKQHFNWETTVEMRKPCP